MKHLYVLAFLLLAGPALLYVGWKQPFVLLQTPHAQTNQAPETPSCPPQRIPVGAAEVDTLLYPELYQNALGRKQLAQIATAMSMPRVETRRSHSSACLGSLSGKRIAVVGGSVANVKIRSSDFDIIICMNTVVFALDSDLKHLRCDVVTLNGWLVRAMHKSTKIHQLIVRHKIRVVLPGYPSTGLTAAFAGSDICVDTPLSRTRGKFKDCLEKNGMRFLPTSGTYLLHELSQTDLSHLYMTGFTWYDPSLPMYARNSNLMGDKTSLMDPLTGKLKPRKDDSPHTYSHDKLFAAMMLLADHRLQFDPTMIQLLMRSIQTFEFLHPFCRAVKQSLTHGLCHDSGSSKSISTGK